MNQLQEEQWFEEPVEKYKAILSDVNVKNVF